MPDKPCLITVDDDHLDKINEVAKELKAKGLKVDRVHEATGIITGSTDKSLASLRTVRGVASVERETQMGIPPGEMDAQ